MRIYLVWDQLLCFLQVLGSTMGQPSACLKDGLCYSPILASTNQNWYSGKTNNPPSEGLPTLAISTPKSPSFAGELLSKSEQLNQRDQTTQTFVLSPHPPLQLGVPPCRAVVTEQSLRIETEAHVQFPIHQAVLRIRDPGSGIGAFSTPGSGIRNRFILNPGSRISDPGSRIPDLGSWIPDPKLIFLRA